MKNETLVALSEKLGSIQYLLDLADMKTMVTCKEMDKAKSGRDDYAHNIVSVIFSFLSMHNAKYQEAKVRYTVALSEQAKVIKAFDDICKDIEQYAYNCIPLEHRDAAIVGYKPFDNYVSISYFVDGDVGNEFVRLRLYINGNEG